MSIGAGLVHDEPMIGNQKNSISVNNELQYII